MTCATSQKTNKTLERGCQRHGSSSTDDEATMNPPASLWQPAGTQYDCERPSLILFLPYASGGLSIRRIITRLTDGQYRLCETDIDAWWGKDEENIYDLRPTGHIYIFFNPLRMKQAILDSGLALDTLTYLVCLRDPRDLLASLYFLTQDHTHIAITQGSPIYQQMLDAAEKAAATSIDDFVRGPNADVLRGMMDDLRAVLAEIPEANIRHLSYAALCHAFPQYLASLIAALGAHPSRATITDILRTEDIQRPQTLHSDSLARFPKASPNPGRHKRDLQPATIDHLTREFRINLDWMARHDIPEFRELYG